MKKYLNIHELLAKTKNRKFHFYVGKRTAHVYMGEDAPDDIDLRAHGYNVKWDYPSLFECSLCGWECYDTYTGDTVTYQYCPNCGAKMDAEPPKEEEIKI